tara:strand:- start:682 stop:1155 length:474 start_codon:yes stop_codon:yes gene_type:complete
MGAGILPFAFHKGDVYFLFSREHDKNSNNGRGWSDFGGKKEGNEKYIETAAREGWEESSGFLGNKTTVKNLVKQNYGYIDIGGYRTYLVEIPYSEKLPKKFRKDFLAKKKSRPDLICKWGLFEKDMLKWVRADKLTTFYPNFRRFYKKIVMELIKIE